MTPRKPQPICRPQPARAQNTQQVKHADTDAESQYCCLLFLPCSPSAQSSCLCSWDHKMDDQDMRFPSGVQGCRGPFHNFLLVSDINLTRSSYRADLLTAGSAAHPPGHGPAENTTPTPPSPTRYPASLSHTPNSTSLPPERLTHPPIQHVQETKTQTAQARRHLHPAVLGHCAHVSCERGAWAWVG